MQTPEYFILKITKCESEMNQAWRFLKNISCSSQLSMKFIMFINVKMPIIVGILTYICRINTTSERFKQEKKFQKFKPLHRKCMVFMTLFFSILLSVSN